MARAALPSLPRQHVLATALCVGIGSANVVRLPLALALAAAATVLLAAPRLLALTCALLLLGWWWGSGLGGERRGVVLGVVLGDETGLSRGLRDRFGASGLYHLLAVSGQNVVLVGGGALLLAWLLAIPRRFGELGALAAIGGYMLAV